MGIFNTKTKDDGECRGGLGNVEDREIQMDKWMRLGVRFYETDGFSSWFLNGAYEFAQ